MTARIRYATARFRWIKPPGREMGKKMLLGHTQTLRPVVCCILFQLLLLFSQTERESCENKSITTGYILS